MSEEGLRNRERKITIITIILNIKNEAYVEYVIKGQSYFSKCNMSDRGLRNSRKKGWDYHRERKITIIPLF